MSLSSITIGLYDEAAIEIDGDELGPWLNIRSKTTNTQVRMTDTLWEQLARIVRDHEFEIEAQVRAEEFAAGYTLSKHLLAEEMAGEIDVETLGQPTDPTPAKDTVDEPDRIDEYADVAHGIRDDD